MERCIRCGRRVLLSRYRDDAGRYCSIHCYASNSNLAFCPACQDATTDDRAGGTFTFNGIGTIFAGAKGRCPECHSVIQGRYIAFAWVPIVPLGPRRVIYMARRSITDPIRFVANRLTSDAAVDAARLPSERGALTPLRRFAILISVFLATVAAQEIENRQLRESTRDEVLLACGDNSVCQVAIKQHFAPCFDAATGGQFFAQTVDKATLAECINRKAGSLMLRTSPTR